jgi:nitrogen fixation protein FixH
LSAKKVPESTAVTPTSLGQLSIEHRAEVEKGSGVSPEMVEGRYFTVTTAEARSLGFSKEQASAGWAVRLSSPTGEVSYQLKRDTPRLVKEDGKLKAVKYETPSGRACIVDVHPANAARLLDVSEDLSEDLWIVEGAKKGDCIASRGRLALVLAGVWNWGKKREEGGVKYGRPELLPDWSSIPLEGRRVFIAFDADFREKRGVALAMMRLAERLTEQGALVYIISLPSGETNLGKGLDDYVVAGGDLEELEAAAKPYQACDYPLCCHPRSARVECRGDRRGAHGVRYLEG